MDANHEKKEIARQNQAWIGRKKAKNNLSKGHPWLSTDARAVHKLYKKLEKLEQSEEENDINL